MLWLAAADAANKAGITWKQNVLRHSFCSYGVALRGLEWTADQADHDIRILRRNYREVVSRQEAELISESAPVRSRQFLLEPRYPSQATADRISVVGNLRATTGKEDVPDNLLARCPVFAFADTQILRERNRPFSQLVSGRTSTNLVLRRSPGHLPSPDLLDTNSSRVPQHCRSDSPMGIFTLEMSEPVF